MPAFIYCIFWLICFTGAFSSFSQEGFCKFIRIVDENDKAIPFAFIKSDKLNSGISADISGKGRLCVDTLSHLDSYQVAILGYKNKFIGPHSSLKTQDTIVVQLEKNVYSLPTVSLNGMTAESILKQALDTLYANFPEEPFSLLGTYGEYVLNDKGEKRFVVSRLELFKTYSRRIKRPKHIKEKFQLLQGFENSNEIHDLYHYNSINHLFMANPLHYQSSFDQDYTEISKKAVLDSISFYDDRLVYVISTPLLESKHPGIYILLSLSGGVIFTG